MTSLTKKEFAHWNKLTNDPLNECGRRKYWHKLAKKYGFHPLTMSINQDGELGIGGY